MTNDSTLDPNADPCGDARPPSSLTDVLGQNEAAKELVVEAVAELSAISSGLKQELAELHPIHGLESALEKSEAVGEKV